MHTHTLLGSDYGYTHRFELKEHYNEWPYVLAPVPRQRTLGDTLLLTVILGKTGKLYPYPAYQEEKTLFIDKIYKAVVRNKGNEVIKILCGALNGELSKTAIERLLFDKNDKTDVLAARAITGNVYFTPVRYNYELMTSLISMMYGVTIHTIDAGTIYTLGLQRAIAIVIKH
jgi:hypothetical protein